MKKIDYFLLVFIFGSLLIFGFSNEIKIGFLIKFIIAFIILCLFLYTKIKPVKNNLSPNFKKTYSIIELFFDKIFSFMGTFIKPVGIGTNISIDISQIILLILLLIFLLL